MAENRPETQPTGSSGHALPRPPDRPDDAECCHRGCCPCIFDYYEDALERWKALVRRLDGDPDHVLTALGRR